MTRTPLILAALLCLTTPALAQGLSTNSKEPLEVTADGTLEWLRNDKTFIAKQNAMAKQGDASVSAATLTALYRDGQNGSDMEIYQVKADTNVVLRSADSTAYGDNAIYKLDEGLATLTGNDLKLVMPDQTVTARDQFEYWTTDGRFNAIGNAQVVRPKVGGGTDTLQGDKISAILKENEKGEQVLDSLEATGNVVIITPAETVTGAYAIYRSGTNKAELTGGVTIKRGPNTLEGQRAVVDMTTNISTIYGEEGKPTGRVRGVFYPGSDGSP